MERLYAADNLLAAALAAFKEGLEDIPDYRRKILSLIMTAAGQGYWKPTGPDIVVKAVLPYGGSTALVLFTQDQKIMAMIVGLDDITSGTFETGPVFVSENGIPASVIEVLNSVPEFELA